MSNHEIVHDMMARHLPLAVLTGIEDDDVTEIYLNPHDGHLRFDTHSQGKIDTGILVTQSRVEMFLNTVAAHHGMQLTETHPFIQAELPLAVFRGSRLQGFLHPITSGPGFVIRKPPSTVLPLDHYVTAGLLSDAHYACLVSAIEAHRNVLIVGGTNSGKTTLANALLREISTRCPMDRIVILEDTVELQCTAEDHLAFRATSDVSLAQLVRMTLRVTPTRIVVGEVRDASALDLLDAWATGHPGGIATLHATDAQGALLRLDRLTLRANVPSQVALIAEAIHFIVVMSNGPSGRRVSDIVHIDGLAPTGDFRLHPIPS